MSNRSRPHVSEGAAPIRRWAAVWHAFAVALAVFTLVARSATPTVAAARTTSEITRATSHAHAVFAAIRAGERHAESSVSDRHDPNADLPLLGAAFALHVPRAAVVRELPIHRGVPEHSGAERAIAAIARGPPSPSTS